MIWLAAGLGLAAGSLLGFGLAWIFHLLDSEEVVEDPDEDGELAFEGEAIEVDEEDLIEVLDEEEFIDAMRREGQL